MGEGSPRKSRRRGRKSPPQSNTPAGAFLQDRVFGPRPTFGFLTPDHLDFLRDRAISLLADYGAVVVHPKARDACLKAGGREGGTADRIRLPRDLIAEALRETPRSTLLAGRDPQYDTSLPRADGGFIMRTGTGGHGYVEPRDASYRNMDVSAAREIALVANDLDQIGFIAHPFVHGVPRSPPTSTPMPRFLPTPENTDGSSPTRRKTSSTC